MSRRLLQKVEKVILISFLFLLPTQLAYHFWPSWAFVFGIRADLLAPSIYLTDILVVFLLLFKVFRTKEFFKPLKKHTIFLCLVLAFAVINSLFSSSPPVSIYKWLKVAEFFFAAF